MAADIVRLCEAEGERRRHEIISIAEARAKRQDSICGHITTFRSHEDPKPCRKCLHVLQHGGEPDQECLRCGSGSGI